MNCENFEEVLNAELDNLLSPAERQELANHLQACRNCRHSAQGYRQLKELMAQFAPVQVPKGFTELVMARIRALPAYSQNQDRYSVVGFSMALVASVAALFLLLGDSAIQKEPTQIVSRPIIVDKGINTFELRKGNTNADFQLVSAQGMVQVMGSESLVWSDVSDGMILKFGDKVRTLSDSKVHLKYMDDTRLKLNSNSLVQVEPNGIRVFQGDSWVKVVKKGRIFQTWTPNLVASVRGTIYDVSVRSKQRSYEDFLREITRQNLGKGLSPEAYFEGVSLKALTEAGRVETSHKIDSTVRVYESSVDVTPIKDEAPLTAQTVIVPEGQLISVHSEGQKLITASLKPLTGEDYQRWEMAVPQPGNATAVQVPDNVPVPPSSSPNLKKPSPGEEDSGSQPSFQHLLRKE